MSKVSVIIPVYNAEKYLAECLDSVINQTEKDIEVICVEDCSTDLSLEILQDYAKKDGRIIILKNRQNSGQSVTRNNGLAIAQGEYVLFVDSDDFIEPTLLETTLKYANDVDMVCFDYKEYNLHNIGSFSHNYLIDNGLYSNEEYFVESEKNNSFIVVAWSKLYRREFLIQNNLHFKSGMIYEDNLFYLQCVLKAKNVYSINEQLYIYRIRPGSTMTKKLQPKNVNDQFRLLCEVIKAYLESDVSKKFSIAIEKFLQLILGYCAYVQKQYIKENENIHNCFKDDNIKYNKLGEMFSKYLVGISNCIDFSDEQQKQLRESKNIIVYGAGDIASEVINYLNLKDIAITGVVVSNIENSKKSFMGHRVKVLSDYKNIKKECLVLISVTSKYSEAIRENLEKQGFENYIKLF